jgi:hypothetical protein
MGEEGEGMLLGRVGEVVGDVAPPLLVPSVSFAFLASFDLHRLPSPSPVLLFPPLSCIISR